MIPSGISPEHILDAINIAASKLYPANREKRRHELMFEGVAYPLKVVIDLAELIALEGIVSTERAREYLTDKKPDFNALEAKAALTKMGFPVNSIEENNQDGFFLLSDLDFFRRKAGDVYDTKNPVSRNAGNFVAATIWEKTFEWGKKIEQWTGLKLQTGRYWLERGTKKDRTPLIKKYTWYKLKQDGRGSNKVFYTVGVWAPDRQLVLKLDCQRQGNSALAPSQIAAFDRFIAESNVGELHVHYDELTQWNWDRLLQASLSFINETSEVFHNAMTLIEQQHENVYARVCYNDLAWTTPSGKEGKSTTPLSSIEFLQERDFGFAPDEWLFDFDRIADDGFHYARIEPLTPGSHVNKVYNIIFYALDDRDNQWYWVGEVKNVQAIDTRLSAEISYEYEAKGWLEQQLSELQKWEGVMWEHYRDMDPGQRFNLRFRVEDCVVFNYRPFAENERPPSMRYNLAVRDSEPVTPTINSIGGLNLGAIGHDRVSRKVIRKFFTGGFRELDNVHSEIQDAFMQYFPMKLPMMEFYSEVRKTGLFNRIDIVATPRQGDGCIFYEIKTYPNVLQSIRVAVGQLLEYALYPNQDLCRMFYIVSHIEANDLELQYLQHLGDKLSMQFGFIHFDRKGQDFKIQLC